MRNIELLRVKPLDEKYFQEVEYENDSFDICTGCGNEEILYVLDIENHICYDCYNKLDKEEGII